MHSSLVAAAAQSGSWKDIQTVKNRPQVRYKPIQLYYEDLKQMYVANCTKICSHSKPLLETEYQYSI